MFIMNDNKCESAPQKKRDLQRFYEAGDFKNYAILAHALKSTSGTIGADSLFVCARELEMAAKENWKDFVLTNHGELMARYEAVEKCVAGVCGGASPVQEERMEEADEDIIEFFPDEG